MPITFEFRPRPGGAEIWKGPYTPARGDTTGYRFRNRRLGVLVYRGNTTSFWEFQPCSGIQAIEQIVLKRWGGGRVLFIPGGLVIKPESNAGLVGTRALLGAYQGHVALRRPDGSYFDWESFNALASGAPWPGPTTTGLECAIASDGSLTTEWSQVAQHGRMMRRAVVAQPNERLYAGFRRARPGDTGGRVRVQMDGSVITNRHVGTEWHSVYVGRVDPRDFGIRVAKLDV